MTDTNVDVTGGNNIGTGGGVGTENSVDSKADAADSVIVDKDIGLLIFNCPHCGLTTTVVICEIACGIFRHGFDTVSKNQINPHEAKETCDKLAADPNIVGCCKPFKIELVGDKYVVNICDYI